MEEKNKKKNGKFTQDLRHLVIFLGSTAFVKFHKKFLDPSTESISNDHLASIANFFHHGMHFLISTAIQIGLLLWLVGIIFAAWKAIGKER